MDYTRPKINAGSDEEGGMEVELDKQQVITMDDIFGTSKNNAIKVEEDNNNNPFENINNATNGKNKGIKHEEGEESGQFDWN